MSIPYRVVFTSRSALKVVKRREWTGPGYRVRLRDDISEGMGLDSDAHVGLIYSVDIDSEDAYRALSEATLLCRRITDEVALIEPGKE